MHGATVRIMEGKTVELIKWSSTLHAEPRIESDDAPRATGKLAISKRKNCVKRENFESA